MSGSAAPSRLPGRILAALALALPFEPRRPTLNVAGLQFTMLELAAAAAMLLLALAERRRLMERLRSPPLPVVALGAFALAHVASALVAPAHRGAALAFSLRMAAAAALAGLVMACDGRAIRSAQRGLMLAACLVGALALLEALGVRSLDPFLDRFRTSPFVIGVSRRASAASENPNLCAALLGYGLIAGVGLSVGPRGAWRAAGLALFLSLGLLCTYSRGGLLAALLGIGTLGIALRASKSARGAAVALGILATCAGGFAAANPAFRDRLAVEQQFSTHRARYEPTEASLALSPGEVRQLSLRVTNAGSQPWTPEDGFRLNCVWYAPGGLSDAGCRTPLPAQLSPGRSVTLSAAVRAPDSPGTYLLLWEIGLGRFRSLGTPPAAVTATVGDGGGAAPSRVPSLVSDQSRLELWKLAIDMWRERPLLGFGPDNFRRLHASYAGWPLGDPPHSAHNSFLEAAANTGTLGLAALLTTLVSSASAARRTSMQPGPPETRAGGAILLGLLAAISAHACVDHLLGFTAHYLLLGLVVGATTARSAPSSGVGS